MNSTQLPWLQMAPKAPASSRVTSSTLSPPSCCRTDQLPVSTGGESGSAARASPPARGAPASAAPMHIAAASEGMGVWDTSDPPGEGHVPVVQWVCLWRPPAGSARLCPDPRGLRRGRDARDGGGRFLVMLRGVAEAAVDGVEGDQQEVDEELFCGHEDSGSVRAGVPCSR